MDIATVFGLLLAAACLVYSVTVSGGSLDALVDYPSLAIVFGGAMAAFLMCFPMKSCRQFPRVLSKSLFNRTPDLHRTVRLLVSLAETARREGLLALETRVDEIDDRFLRQGVQMAVDGVRPEMLEEILRSEMDAVAGRHREGKSLMDQLGKFLPAFGMIGTLLGLIVMLGQMADPSSIGNGMAVALITTLYGAVAANAFFLPLAEKLGFYHKSELIAMEVALKGVLAIQSGESPRVVEQRLSIFLPPTAGVSHQIVIPIR